MRALRLSTLLCLLWCSGLLGCDDASPPGDPRPEGDGDAAGDGDDGRVWTPRDAGPRGGDGDAYGYDSECNLLFLARASATLPVCAESTRRCIDGCGTTPGCTDACIAADPSAGTLDFDCDGCLITGQFMCMADNGCADEINDFSCCFEMECLSGQDNCVGIQCSDQLQAAINCGIQKAPQCLAQTGPATADCFPAPDADAGM